MKKNIKIGQVYTRFFYDDNNIEYNWNKSLSFRLNKITQWNTIAGVIIRCSYYAEFENDRNELMVGYPYIVTSNEINSNSVRLEKDITGYNCTKCRSFYNEAQSNFGDKFLCWKCSVPLFQ